jgi:hypothetical protein
MDRGVVQRDYANMPKKRKASRAPLTFDDVREIALAMPEVEEARAWGCPTLKAGGTLFAARPYPRRDVEPSSLGVSMGLEERARALASRPDVYYLTDHYAKYPGVLVRLSSIGRGELRKILSAAWQYAMEQGSAKRAQTKSKARARRGRR